MSHTTNHIHSSTRCPRCSSTMTCRRDEIRSCDCNKIELSKDTLTFLASTEWVCLCNDCLQYFENLVVSCRLLAPVTSSTTVREGIHYKISGGLWVFTDTYHYLRGYCCRSRCKHCVYQSWDGDESTSS